MSPKIWGWQHIVYLIVFVAVSLATIFLSKKYAKTEKSQKIILKIIAGILLISILTNRLSIVFKSGTPNWIKIIPESFCGMSSLVLSLAVLLGKKNNNVLHFVWFMALLGDVLTMAYPDFIGQSISIWYLPTISGLLHHSIAALLVIMFLVFNQIEITYKKWYCTVFGFTSYITLGAFLISFCGQSDAFYINHPILSGTPLNVWLMIPIYVALYSIVLLTIELIRKRKTKKRTTQTN